MWALGGDCICILFFQGPRLCTEALRRVAAQHRLRELLLTEPTPEPETKQPTAIVTAMTTETTTSACGNGHKMAVIVDPRNGNDDAARKPPVPLLQPSSICSSF